MPGGFGFQRYPQRPSPPPAAVGSALEAQQLAQTPGMQPGLHTPGYLPYGQAGAAMEAQPMGVGSALLAAGGPNAGGMAPGSPPTAMTAPAGDEPPPAGVGEALMRGMNGNSGSRNPAKNTAGNAAHLLRLGMHPDDVRGLMANGGI